MKRAVCVQEAKHVLTDCFGATDPDAVLRAWSAHLNIPIPQIADVLVRHIWQGERIPEDRALTRAIEKFLRQLPDLPVAKETTPPQSAAGLV
jgi:hypothetical protein